MPKLAYVQLELNHDSDIGPARSGTNTYLNVHPVFPISLGSDWTLISKTYISLEYARDPASGADSRYGIGHIVPAFFFSPSRPADSNFQWGLGPIFLLPTSSEIGTNEWGVGPTGFAVAQSGAWTYGIVADHIETLSHSAQGSDISATYFQPFVNFTAGTSTFGISPETIYDWNAKEYSVPINLLASKVIRMGERPVQIGAGLRYWIQNPDNLAHGWGARLSITFLPSR